MKHCTVLLFVSILLICISMNGCNQKEDKEIIKDNIFIENQDYQYQFANQYFDSDKINKAENGYYTICDKFIYFIDEKTMKATPLCNKPNCLHNNETDKDLKKECNAYIDTIVADYSQKLYSYNGNIYYFREYISEEATLNTDIVKCSADGENKEVLATLEDQQNNNMLVHRGYLYYTSTTFTVTDRKGNNGKTICESDTKLYRIDLNKNNTKPEVFMEKSDFEDFEDDKSLIIHHISAYGNYLLLLGDTPIYYTDDGNKGSISICDDPQKYYTVNLETKEIYDINTIKFPEENTQYGMFTYLDGKIMFNLCKNDKKELYNSPNIYTMNFDGTDIQKVFTTQGEFVESTITTDKDYIYITGIKLSKHKIIQIYDHNFNLLNTTSVPVESSLENTAWFLPGVGDKLINWGEKEVYDENNEPHTDGYCVKYIEKSELLKADGDTDWKYVTGIE